MSTAAAATQVIIINPASAIHGPIDWTLSLTIAAEPTPVEPATDAPTESADPRSPRVPRKLDPVDELASPPPIADPLYRLISMRIARYKNGRDNLDREMARDEPRKLNLMVHMAQNNIAKQKTARVILSAFSKAWVQKVWEKRSRRPKGEWWGIWSAGRLWISDGENLIDIPAAAIIGNPSDALGPAKVEDAPAASRDTTPAAAPLDVEKIREQVRHLLELVAAPQGCTCDAANPSAPGPIPNHPEPLAI